MFNEIDTADLSTLLNEGAAEKAAYDDAIKDMFTGGFSDEDFGTEQDRNGKVKDDWKPELKDDMGEEIDFNSIMDDDPIDSVELDDEDKPAKEFGDSENLDDEAYYSIDGNEYAVDEIKTAVKAMDSIKQFDTIREHFRTGMQTLASKFEEAEFIRKGELDQSIEHWKGQMDNAKTSEQWQQAKYNFDLANSRKASLASEFESYQREMQAGKQRQEEMEAQQIVNELVYKHNWNNEDFGTAAKYIQDNGINIKPEQASANLMMTIRKAAMFDERRTNKEAEISRKVKPLVNKPVSSSNIDTYASKQDDTRKRKAAKLAAEGQLSASDMFAFLDD